MLQKEELDRMNQLLNKLPKIALKVNQFILLRIEA